MANLQITGSIVEKIHKAITGKELPNGPEYARVFDAVAGEIARAQHNMLFDLKINFHPPIPTEYMTKDFGEGFKAAVKTFEDLILEYIREAADTSKRGNT